MLLQHEGAGIFIPDSVVSVKGKTTVPNPLICGAFKPQNGLIVNPCFELFLYLFCLWFFVFFLAGGLG